MTAARRVVLVLAIAGCAIATYLAAYQVGLTASVWDPLFGTSSEAVITSPLSRALPVPDAALGALAYACEAILAAVAHKHPSLLVGFGAVVVALALAGLALLIVQAVVVHAFCTLCLASAAISFLNLVLARDEVAASLHLFTTDARRSIAI